MPTSYVLGSDPEELNRLVQQHELWRPMAEAAWQRAGLTGGMAVLDLGCGPGLASLDLARVVGPAGRVLALEADGTYLAHARQLAADAGMSQLSFQEHDLCAEPLPLRGFHLAWCRWVAMFLPSVEPLLDQLDQALLPGGVALFHEYLHWQTFGLHPHGEVLQRFAGQVLASFEARGADADVNRHLASRLARRGYRIEELRALPAVGGNDSWTARWLEPFVRVYGQRLQARGLWSAEDAAAAEAAMAAAHRDPGSVWVGPTVLELRARRC